MAGNADEARSAGGTRANGDASGKSGPAALPGPDSRWRCGHCGNLTRFDVVRTRTTEEFWHFTLSGSPEIEETKVRSESVLQVSCRWCGATDAIEVVARPGDSPDDLDTKVLGGTP